MEEMIWACFEGGHGPERDVAPYMDGIKVS
jgi:hypothetical protein